MATTKDWWSTADSDADPRWVSERALHRLLERLAPRRHHRSDLVADGLEFPRYAVPEGTYDGYVDFSGEGPLPDLRGWPHLPSPIPPVLLGEAIFSTTVAFHAPDRRLIRPFMNALVDGPPLSPPEAFATLSARTPSGDRRTASVYVGTQFRGEGSKLGVMMSDRIEEARRIVEGAAGEDQMVQEPPPKPPHRPQPGEQASYTAASPQVAVRVLGRLCDPAAGLGAEWSISDLAITHLEKDWKPTYDALRRATAAAPLGAWAVTTYVTAEHDPSMLDVLTEQTDHFALPLLTFRLRSGEWAVLRVSWERGREPEEAYGVNVAVYAPDPEAERLAWAFLDEEVSTAVEPSAPNRDVPGR